MIHYDELPQWVWDGDILERDGVRYIADVDHRIWVAEHDEYDYIRFPRRTFIGKSSKEVLEKIRGA